MTLKTFKNKKKEWCWHIKAKNGEIIAQGEGYKNKKDMMEAIELLRQHFNPKKKRNPPKRRKMVSNHLGKYKV